MCYNYFMRTKEILRINQIANGRECPGCGEYERFGHNDNGERGDALSFCCESCGEHWDAAVWFAKLPEDAHEVLS